MPDFKFPRPILILIFLLIHSLIGGKVTGKTNSNFLEEYQIESSDQFVEILEDGMYVIVGAFRIKTNAVRYAQSLEIHGKKPNVGKYKVNNLYYVYAYKSKDDLQYVREKRSELRATSQFFDAWILYVGVNLQELLSLVENQIILGDQNGEILEDGMYVIVGAFRVKTNAVRYAQSLEIHGKKPNVGKYKVNNLYYVYAYKSKDDLQYVREKRSELRATSQFFDAWILYVGINLQELLSKVTSEKPGSIQPQEPVAVQMPEPEEQQVTSSTLDNTDAYQYLFNVTNATNLKEVTGYIKIIDAARNKVMKSVSTNQIHTINAPGTETNEIIVLCDIFGFVKEQIVLKTDDPINSPDKAKISQKDGITTVTFSLSRHKKVGEILTMFNVYFYKDAAIMKPESIFELNNLLSMVKENEKLTIRIHGHTNGNSAGKIISLKKDDDNFFQVTNNNIKGFGSAKELSKQRAEVIQRWLMSNGISKSRMELKAWGGKKMIYKKRDKMAERNVRVEIEILKL